ncbi:MAG: YfcE family phosphodiesterase [Candidatus Methanomethylicota archaeon]|uniref:Phosphoesterase n=2 Tax=Thermoproteota archaeon TaxID=2056631 RepID=A0A497EZC3_9CREN|nr:MAG: YfcE family phosphodiesterase [Candidatus Verstraetearchaeota archaeon]
MRVLVIGDFHIPTRAKSIPQQFTPIISKGDFDVILSTGDFVERKVLSYLESIATTVWVVGNMDFFAYHPRERMVNLEGFKIGLTHGAQIYPRGDPLKLYSLAVKLGVDILISGHTHVASTKLVKDILLLNPGSATGCWSGSGGSLIPSFMILNVEGDRLSVSTYELVKSKIRITTETFTKSSDGKAILRAT